MTNDIFFSVMICCYNSEKYLRETIDSVIKQTYTNWEIVAINDGSTDNTEKIIMSYINKGIPITYHKQKNKGFAAARNKAMELAKGTWIAIIDHDDICMPNRLEIQTKQIKSNPSAKLFFSDVIHLNNSAFKFRCHFDKIDLNGFNSSAGQITNYYLKHSNLIASCSVVFEKRASISIGKFDTSFQYLVDVDYFLRMSEKYNFYLSKEILAKWRIHSGQTTNKLEESLRLIEGNRIIFTYLIKDIVFISTKLFLVYIFFRRYIAMFFRRFLNSRI